MTTINAQKVWPAREGKKFGKIVDLSGAEFMLPVGIQNLFQAGGTYEVATSQKKWGDSVVTVIDGRPAGAPPPVSPYTPTAPPYAPPQQTPAPQAQRPANGYSNSPSKDVAITAIALMKSFIESGNFGLTDLPSLEAACIPAAKRIVAASQ